MFEGITLMIKLVLLLTFGFRKRFEKVGCWLRETYWNSLFINLPAESERYITAYVEGKIDQREFWKYFTLLTGFAEPFINSLKLRFQPILESIKDISLNKREIHYYSDLKSYIEEKKIQEKILLLQFRLRTTSRLDLKEWKHTLIEEIKVSEDSWQRSADKLLSEAKEIYPNIILCGGYLNSIKSYLKKPNNKIEFILLDDYWKSPLDILRTIIWKYGIENIDEKKIELYLKLQKRYLDLVLTSKDIDEAHETWTNMAKKPSITWKNISQEISSITV